MLCEGLHELVCGDSSHCALAFETLPPAAGQLWAPLMSVQLAMHSIHSLLMFIAFIVC